MSDDRHTLRCTHTLLLNPICVSCLWCRERFSSVSCEHSLQLIGAGGESRECFYGNQRRMLAKLQRCAVVITSCSSSHRLFDCQTLDVQTKYGVIPLFSSCFQFVNITENKKTENLTIYNKSSLHFSSFYLLALRPLLFKPPIQVKHNQ